MKFVDMHCDTLYELLQKKKRGEQYSLYKNEYIYPDYEITTQIFTDLPKETLQIMTDYWDDLKIDGYDYTVYYICFISFLISIIALTIYRNRKRKKYEYE